MGRPADNQQVRGVDQLRRSPPYGNTLDMGVWICLPNAVADCLGDFTGVTEQALVHDGDLHRVRRLHRGQPDAGHLEEQVNLRLVIATPVG
jgi:hypothetical protein